MAVNNSSSVSKTTLYQSLYLISQAIDQITASLEVLQSSNILGPSFAELRKATVRQITAEIAFSSTNKLNTLEGEEAHRFEQTVIRMKEELEK